jgi:hypothetical protein
MQLVHRWDLRSMAGRHGPHCGALGKRQTAAARIGLRPRKSEIRIHSTDMIGYIAAVRAKKLSGVKATEFAGVCPGRYRADSAQRSWAAIRFVRVT